MKCSLIVAAALLATGVRAQSTSVSEDTARGPEGPAGGSTVQFSSATYGVNENGTTATIIVTATPAPAAPMSVSYATSNGTAVSGSDYTTATGTLNFGIGVASQTFNFAIANDTTVEGNETVNLALSGPTGGATLGTPSTAELTIPNDDFASLSLNTPAVAEGNAGNTPLPFVLSLSNPVQGAISLDYASADGNNPDPLLNATVADSDYMAASGTVSFPSDSTTPLTINVSIVGDTDVEPSQALRLLLSNLQVPAAIPAGAVSIYTPSGSGQISNDDGATLSVNSPTQAEGNAAGTLAFTVTLSAAVKSPVTVSYTTTPGTATASVDYGPNSGTLTFNPGGALTQQVNVTTTGETIVEANETLQLVLSNPSGATLGVGTGTGTLNNDDTATLSLNAPGVTEGNSGNTPLTYVVTLSALVQGTVSATVNTADGNNGDPTVNATVADNDYVPVVGGTVTIGSGSAIATDVQVVGDTVFEPNQGLRLILSNLQVPAGIPAGAITLGTATGVGTINNDDVAILSIGPATQAEGNAGATPVLNLPVTLSAPSATQVTATFTTSNGTATAGSDYVASTGTVTLTPGQITTQVPVTINGDGLLEGDETFTVTLSAPVGATLGTASAIGTISNDDAVTFSVADARAPEGSSNVAPGQLRFVVSLSSAAAQPVTVDYATAGLTATSGLDYTATSGTLTFTPGSTSQTVTVTVAPDTLQEGDETLSFTLSNPQPGAQVALARAVGTGTITNDDFVTQIPALGARGALLMLLVLATAGLWMVRRNG